MALAPRYDDLPTPGSIKEELDRYAKGIDYHGSTTLRGVEAVIGLHLFIEAKTQRVLSMGERLASTIDPTSPAFAAFVQRQQVLLSALNRLQEAGLGKLASDIESMPELDQMQRPRSTGDAIKRLFGG